MTAIGHLFLIDSWEKAGRWLQSKQGGYDAKSLVRRHEYTDSLPAVSSSSK